MLLTLLATASAAIPTWNWPVGEPQRFHIETEIVTPPGMRYYASENLDARASSVRMRIDTACTAQGGKVKVVTCTLAYVDVTGKAGVLAENEKLGSILTEWTKDLSSASVEMEIGPDGRLRTFDMKGGLDRSNRRQGYIIEQQRMLLQRAFCAFDLPLTTDEKDWVRGWKQKGSSAIMQLQTISGTTGASDIKHTHDGERDGLVVIQTVARGTLSAGAAVDSDSGGRLVDMRLAGETLFDTQKGMLAWRDFTLDGRLTVGSQQAGSGAEYFQVGAIQWIPEFPAPGEVPLSLAAAKAPRLAGTPPALADGVALVQFADLGMDPLYVAGFPESAKSLSLPVTKVSARVTVAADGIPSDVAAFAGFAALGGATEQALRGARFPAKSATYAVDVDVEWRPE